MGCSDIASSKKQRLFIVLEDQPGVIAYPKAEHFIAVANDATANQTPEYEDSPEKLGTRDVLDQFRNATPAATANAAMLLRVGATGQKPQGHDVLVSMFGASTYENPVIFTVEAALETDAEITLSAVESALPPAGVITLDAEDILYTGLSADGLTLTGLTRGYNNTVAADHDADTEGLYKSIAYLQADCNPSFTMWLQTDHFLQAVTGATINEASLSLSNSGPLMFDFSAIQGMQMVMAGTSRVTSTVAAGATVIPVDEPDMYTEKAWVWNPDVDDNGGGADVGYKIVNVDRVAGTITLDQPILKDWLAETSITGFLPQDYALFGEPIEGSDTDVYLDGVPGAFRESSVTYNNNIQYLTDELGAKYPKSYVEDSRTVQLDMNNYFRRQDGVRFVQGYEGQEVPARLDFNHGKAMLYMPRVKQTMPTTSVESPTVSLESTGTALGSGKGNNAIYLVIN